MRKNISGRWVKFAQDDLKDAQILFRNKSYKSCILHCHQSVEKMLKAIISGQGKKIRKTHDLPTLSKDTKISIPDLILEFMEILNPYYTPTRYPDVIPQVPFNYSRKSTKNILKKTEEIYRWLKWQLNQLK